MTVALLRFILSSMKIINRYFSRQLIVIFFMLLLILTGLAWMMEVMSMMKFLMTYGVNFGDFIGLTALMLPFIASIVIPFVTFIVVIFVYNKMIADNEVSVLAASGLSPAQIARPAILLATIMTVCHLALNIWVVPISQAQFYNTQWNLRYGLAHLKLQESAFTELTNDLVVYVDKVSGHDMSQLMLSDTRDKTNEMIIFAEKGKLVSTMRGLSIVMSNGSLQSMGDSLTTGTFESFDMDLNVAEKENENSFRVRRIPTFILIKNLRDAPDMHQHKVILSELSTRLLAPFMNLILATLCTLILLKASLLRRRASFAPILSVIAMAIVMASFMSASNMIEHVYEFAILFIIVILVLCGVMFALHKK